VKKILLLTVIALIRMTGTTYGQTQDVVQLIAQLQNPDWTIRAAAFEDLSEVGFATSDQLKLAAIALLNTENANNTLKPSVISDDNEAYGEYYGDVIQAVARLNDLRSISALVGAINTGNMAGDAIAGFGTSALELVLQQLSSQNDTVRGSAALTIGKMVDTNLLGDSNSRSKIRNALNNASTDPDYYVGLSAIGSLLKLFGITATGLPNRVLVDIKPGGYPNAINPRDNGLIPLAIFSTSTFDARTIDPATLKFGPGQAGPANPVHVEDLNSDGRPDIVIQFSTPSSQIACSDKASFLVGKTTTGEMIVGSDSIFTVNCK